MNIPQMSDTSLQFSTFAWPGLLKHLRQMLMANTKMEAGQSSSIPQQTAAITLEDLDMNSLEMGHLARLFHAGHPPVAFIAEANQVLI